MILLALSLLSCPTEPKHDSQVFYTVAFDSRGGSPVESQSVLPNSKAQVPPLRPSKDGFIFAGWYADQGYTKQYYFDVPVTADITLYAKWEEGKASAVKTFWASNLNNDTPYQIQAELLAEGEHCKIWVEQDPRGPTGLSAARSLARAYDEDIYPVMIANFSVDPSAIDPAVGANIMDYADYLADGDGKLSILLLDIKDSYNPPTSYGYVAGYFSPADFFSVYRGSNMTDMIYVDTYPGVPGQGESNKTLAHEMQHLMNFATRYLMTPPGKTTVDLMDLWIDEGLSSAAEYLYQKDHAEDRYKWFNEDPMGTIAKGNNFFIWGNYQNDSILDDYATVYLFFQWLRIQSGGAGIYKSIIKSEYYDYRAVTGPAPLPPGIETGSDEEKWAVLLKTWMTANYINAPSGLYGYNQEPKLSGVKAKTAGTTTLTLLPGEGVYSRTNRADSTASYSSNSGPHIKYAGLNPGAADLPVSDSDTFAGGALLTYNANPDQKGLQETGRLTGIMGSTGAGSRSALVREGPFRIDARDMPARGWGKESP
jgi:uncharacterized repeat protein (TIGR02543 family)